MTEPTPLTPATRPGPEPEAVLRGWSQADLTSDELVDDAFIDADPDSQVVTHT